MDKISTECGIGVHLVFSMSKSKIQPGLLFFGNLIDLGCHVRDLEIVLRKSEEIEFPTDGKRYEGDSLISDIFPDIMRKSFVVTLLIALDDQFKIYCEVLRDATNQTLKWNDLKGSALERFITIARKSVG